MFLSVEFKSFLNSFYSKLYTFVGYFDSQQNDPLWVTITWLVKTLPVNPE